jgi:hypothetical protein
VLRCSGGRVLAIALTAAQAIYVSTAFEPIRHVRELRDWDPPFIDRLLAADGALVLVEANPHRDMDRHPTRRTPTTPFDVHFEGLLPHLNGQRFYAQMIDGWTWSRWRGEVVAAGTFKGSPIAETPPAEFTAEMARWGVRHLFVWTDATRTYLAGGGGYVERWRGGRWSHFERLQADGRSVVTANGSGELRNLDWLGADVVLRDVREGEPVVVRSRYYPAWRAFAAGREVAVRDAGGQLAFDAPASGAYTVRLEYPRYRALSLLALASFLVGAFVLARWPRGQIVSTSASSPAPAAET